jgi:chemotaxis protein CheC
MTAGLLTAELDRLGDVVGRALERSAEAFSEMVGQPVTMTSPKVRMVPYYELGEVTFRPGEPVVGIYLLASAESNAHILLLLAPSDAWVLSQTLLGESPTTVDMDALPDLDDMAQSALGELGNVVSGFFLSFVGDLTGLLLHPSPPAVVTDLAGAIIDAIIIELSQEVSDVLVVDSTISLAENDLDCVLLVMPDLKTRGQLLARMAPA